MQIIYVNFDEFKICIYLKYNNINIFHPLLTVRKVYFF